MPLREKSKSRVADGVASGRRDVGSGVFGAIDVTHRHRVVSRPGIVHTDRKTEVIARLRRRMRAIDSDCCEGPLVPNAGDAVGSRSMNIDCGAAKKQYAQQ